MYPVMPVIYAKSALIVSSSSLWHPTLIPFWKTFRVRDGYQQLFLHVELRIRMERMSILRTCLNKNLKILCFLER